MYVTYLSNFLEYRTQQSNDNVLYETMKSNNTKEQSDATAYVLRSIYRLKRVIQRFPLPQSPRMQYKNWIKPELANFAEARQEIAQRNRLLNRKHTYW